MEFLFRFDSTPADFLAAHRLANRVSIPRRAVQLVGVAFGCLWLTGSLLDWSHETPFGMRVVGILAGAGMIWRFVLHPYVVRREVASSHGGVVDVQLSFSESGISAQTQEGHFHLMWSSVERVIPAADGVLLILTNQSSHWLPVRAFKDAAERARLISFVSHQIRKGSQPAGRIPNPERATRLS